MRVIVLLLLGAFAAHDVIADEKKGESKVDKGRFFGSFSTTTYTVVSAVTSSVFLSCLSGTAATVCKGRNAKRFRKRAELISMEQQPEGRDLGEVDLESSELAPEDIKAPISLSDSSFIKGNEEKFAFTIWTTSRTTTSVTVFFTNTSSTVRLSFYCIAGGMQLPSQGCAG